MAKKKAAKKAVAKKPAKKAKPAAKKAAAKKVSPIPAGYHTITPGAAFTGAARAIDWYKKVFGAKLTTHMPGPGGTVAHCEMQFGDSKVMFGDHMEGMPGWGANHMRLMHYSKDCDTLFNKCVNEGATIIEPLKNQFWGDRAGRVRDPFGNEWFLATHIEDVTPKEMDRRMHEMMAGGAGSDSSEEE